MIFGRIGRKPGPNASGMLDGTDPTNAEVIYDEDELEFLQAVERYQREHRRKFPTFVEILDVLRALGYRKVADPSPLPKYREPAA